jgi:anti-sigma regulatory factor (Ser/Thr protein kinase)
MLAFNFYGSGEKEDELVVDANVDELSKVLEFIDTRLDNLDCPMKTHMHIDVAVEELFVNIAHYAYKPGNGNVIVKFKKSENPLLAEITFIDSGVPYDPLAKKDPDITLSAEDRPIGGLGIFMVKKSMDEMTYEYKDNKNILTLAKYL